MRHLFKLLIPMLAACLLIASCGSSNSKTTTTGAANEPTASETSSATSSEASSGTVVVKTASVKALGTVLVNDQGMTLYHLSGEKNGKFICTSSECTGVWHPVLVQASGTPTGVSSLGTVKRPEGSVQVTYKGTPLYTFAEDKSPGEANGQGIHDVGTWTAVTASSAGTSAGNSAASPSPGESPAGAPASSPPSEPAPSSGGYGY